MECHKNGCNREGTGICHYCHKPFCNVHLRANKPSTPSLSSKYYTPTPTDGHPCAGVPLSKTNRESSHYYSREHINYVQNRDRLVKSIIIIAIILVILYFVFSTNLLNKRTNELGNLASNTNSTLISQTSRISTSSSPSGALIFCINRGVFRTSNSRGLNASQVQNLINYCGYHNYNPGVVNGTNYTSICQGVRSCQNN